jgi:hypothetical protein
MAGAVSWAGVVGADIGVAGRAESDKPSYQSGGSRLFPSVTSRENHVVKVTCVTDQDDLI